MHQERWQLKKNVFHKSKKKRLIWFGDVTDLNHFCWVEMNHLPLKQNHKPLVTIFNKQDLDQNTCGLNVLRCAGCNLTY